MREVMGLPNVVSGTLCGVIRSAVTDLAVCEAATPGPHGR
jgi:hypothetical protein